MMSTQASKGGIPPSFCTSPLVVIAKIQPASDAAAAATDEDDLMGQSFNSQLRLRVLHVMVF